jgi:hypothetical protein
MSRHRGAPGPGFITRLQTGAETDGGVNSGLPGVSGGHYITQLSLLPENDKKPRDEMTFVISKQ